MSYHFHFLSKGNPKYPPLLCLHGFLGSSSDFIPILNPLSQQFYTLAIDLPGHGKTEVIGDDSNYTMANTAQGIIFWLEQLHIKSCFLYGYSMGGRLALYLALHFPQYFPKLVLESASPGLKTEPERQQRRQQDQKIARQLETLPLTKFLENWYKQPLFSSLKNHPQLAFLLENRLNNNPYLLAKSLRHLGTGAQPSLWSKLFSYRHPLLSIVGKYDEKFTKINEEMQKLCYNAQLEIIPETGHNIHLEKPECFLEHLQTFLA